LSTPRSKRASGILSTKSWDLKLPAALLHSTTRTCVSEADALRD
jgi:hypothetical protein